MKYPLFLPPPYNAPSLPVRGAWVEIMHPQVADSIFRSLPVRGAWVEISLVVSMSNANNVAPRAGSVG